MGGLALKRGPVRSRHGPRCSEPGALQTQGDLPSGLSVCPFSALACHKETCITKFKSLCFFSAGIITSKLTIAERLASLCQLLPGEKH